MQQQHRDLRETRVPQVKQVKGVDPKLHHGLVRHSRIRIKVQIWFRLLQVFQHGILTVRCFLKGLFPGGFPHGGVPPPPPPHHGGVPPWIGIQGVNQLPQGQDDGSGRGIDVKWIPQVPECKWSNWKTRRDEQGSCSVYVSRRS